VPTSRSWQTKSTFGAWAVDSVEEEKPLERTLETEEEEFQTEVLNSIGNGGLPDQNGHEDGGELPL
jgi:hypothetical protein